MDPSSNSFNDDIRKRLLDLQKQVTEKKEAAKKDAAKQVRAKAAPSAAVAGATASTSTKKTSTKRSASASGGGGGANKRVKSKKLIESSSSSSSDSDSDVVETSSKPAPNMTVQSETVAAGAGDPPVVNEVSSLNHRASGFGKLRKLAEKARRIPSTEVDKLDLYKTLGDFTRGEVFELHDPESKQSKDANAGGFVMGTYHRVSSAGRKETGRLSLPMRFAEKLQARNVCVYMGKKPNASGKNEYHDLRVVEMDAAMTPKKITQMVESYRSKSVAELDRMLTTFNFGVFPAGTVVIFEQPQLVDTPYAGSSKKTSLVVMYEAVVDDKVLSGQVFVPERLTDQFARRGSGVVVYRGKKATAKGGQMYHDIVFLDEDMIDSLQA